MRLTLLFSFLLVVSSVVRGYAQNGLTVSDPVVTMAVPAGQDFVKVRTELTNDSDSRANVMWIREVNDLPANWFSAICDKNLCWNPPVDSGAFSLMPGETAFLEVQLSTDGMPGSAQVTLRAVDVNDRSNNAVVTFSFPMSSSTRDVFRQGARLYPNPGTDAFDIISDEPLSRVTLTNMLGKVVREYPANLGSYNVSDLPDGLYLATLISTNGRVIKTIRYSKRQVMP